jgi:transcription elongation factor GreB
MSKAFTRESDELSDHRLPLRPSSLLPHGAKNYLTRDGARRLQEELDRLLQMERPRIAASGNTSEAKQHLQTLDQRILYLQRSLESAVIVDPPATQMDLVRFGATVTVRYSSGTESEYRIVGVDETDIDQGCVSWLSPIAKALLNARLGQRVRFKFPSGEEELEIVGIKYG